MQSKDHWNQVYSTKASTNVSWFQEHASQSVALIAQSEIEKGAEIIDVGGGASTLVDDLLGHGYRHLTVLDLSEAALAVARERLGAGGDSVSWIAGDITRVELPVQKYDVWHDRAVFHFLTSEADRHAYVRAVLRAVKPGGLVIVATFAEDGLEQCSGLPVMRYSPDALHAEFGAPFTLLRKAREEHQTPWGATQKFIYCLCRKEAD
ncbi:methyltransferase [Pandoraea communis]|uniref:Methyltransferase n=1 Tax=Pandoraea communis TaxID=2508297 RepID=A0A5E4TLM5_9BURK|nr:class I SAM-dependent methyltransferase [Pandoraea communis]VVD88013.1 methyltransferase [Pandoraea communis]